MQQAIEQELERSGGRWACVVVRLDSATPQKMVSHHADQLFPAASLAKVPILIEVARQVENTTLDWKARYTLPPSMRASSSGVIAHLSPDLQPTLHDLAHLMITISDNTAANMLLHLVGFDAVNATMRQLGLQATRLERRFMDFAARQQGRENWTTAADMAHLFTLLGSHSLPGSQAMLEILLQQNDYNLLPGYWGEDLPFAHKTGDLPGVSHDAGILFPPSASNSGNPAPLVVVVLTANQTDQPFARYLIARVGRIMYQSQ